MAMTKSVFDENDADIEARSIAEVEAEIDAGKGVPHAKVREWLLKLAKGENIPLPCNNLGTRRTSQKARHGWSS
jgi:predicted transcriptional regulator